MSAAAKAPETAAAPEAQPQQPQAPETIESVLAEIKAESAEGEPQGAEQPAEPAADGQPVDDGPAATGWAAIRKQEKRLVRERKELSERTKQIQQRLEEIERRDREFDENPVEFMQRRGLTFDDLARRVLGEGKPSQEELQRRGTEQQTSEVKQLSEKIARLESMLASERETSMIAQYRSSVDDVMKGSEFELLRSMPDAAHEVMNLADRWAAERNELLSARDAAVKIQDEYRKHLEGLSTHEAVRRFFGAAGSQQQKRGRSQVPQGTGESPRTLTNNLAATTRESNGWSNLTPDEEFAEALRIARGG